MNDDEFWDKFDQLLVNYRFEGGQGLVEATAKLKQLILDKLDEMKERGYDLGVGERDY